MERHLRYNNVISIMVLCLMVVFVSSCGEIRKQHQYEDKTLDYLQTRNRDGLFGLFSAELRNASGFEKDLEGFLDELDSYDLDFSKVTKSDGGEDKRIKGGKTVLYKSSVVFENISDSEGNKYEILAKFTIIDKGNSQTEGLTYIKLMQISQDECANQFDNLLYIGITGKEKDCIYTFYKKDEA